MSISKRKLNLLSLLISTSLLSSPIYATEQLNQQAAGIEQSTTKTFPETLQALIDAPGIKDSITIPMPSKYYETEYKKYLDGEWSQKKVSLQDTFKGHTITEKDGLTLVTLKTNIKESFVGTSDLNSEFYYYYTIANGYVLQTKISTFFSQNDESISVKMDYLSDAFSKYLIDKGFKEEKTIMNFIPRMINKTNEFRLDDHIVILKRDNDFFSKRFDVTIQKKQIEDNRDTIMKDVKLNNLKNEYKTLNKILK